MTAHRIGPSDTRVWAAAALLGLVGCAGVSGATGAPLVEGGHEEAMAEIIFRVTVPDDTPADAEIYIAGDFQNWDPGDQDHRLAKAGDGAYEIGIAFDKGRPIQYKFTRGHWGVVEKGPRGEEIANRTFAAAASGTLRLSVASWAGNAPPSRTSSITGDVRPLEVPDFLDGRRVWIYLPPGYEEATDERYPVLYMLDGQNVFDAKTSFAGEWEVDETCERLIKAGEMRPIIVVAVANGETERVHEYTPWFDRHRQAGGGGEEHLRAFIDVLIPFVNMNCRTLEGPANTGLGGSSLGGLMAVYAGYAHPDVFGLIAGVSPVVRWDEHRLVDFVASKERPASRVYIDMGTRESESTEDTDGNGVDDHIDDLRALKDALLAQGFVEGEDLLVVEDEGARHNEAYWAARFPAALRFLFPPE